MHPILEHLKHKLQGKIPAGKKRSSEWPKVRAEHLKLFPRCTVCNGDEKLEVHHIIPFHIRPEEELKPSNLITLCEAKHNGVNCHQLFGHLGNYQCVNKQVEIDSHEWAEKIKRRNGF